MTTLTLAILVSLVAAIAAQNPTSRVIRLLDDIEAPPAELADHLERSDVVVLGQVANRHQRVIGTDDYPIPAIEHEVKVTRVLKGPATMRPGATVLVTQQGGVATVGGVEYVSDDRGFPVFRQGDRLILMLVAHPGWHYAPAWGPAGVYSVRGNTVAIPPTATLSPERNALFGNRTTIPLPEFLRLLSDLLGGDAHLHMGER